jgi:hypothetical protein
MTRNDGTGADEQEFDACAFLAALESRGVRLEREGEQLHAWPSNRLTEEDRATLRGHKRAILETLPQNAQNEKNGETTRPEPPPGVRWDQAEAERLLAGLRDEAEQIARRYFDGAPPPLFRTLAADLLAIGEGYVRGHEIEARRGWDALELLRGLGPLLGQVAGLVERLKALDAKLDGGAKGVPGLTLARLAVTLDAVETRLGKAALALDKAAAGKAK